jgi:hypothetical protein
VGLPRLSKICLAFTDVIVTAISFRRSFLISKKRRLLSVRVGAFCLATRMGVVAGQAGLFVEEVEGWGRGHMAASDLHHVSRWSPPVSLGTWFCLEEGKLGGAFGYHEGLGHLRHIRFSSKLRMYLY